MKLTWNKNPRLGRSYDEFFVSRSRITRIQFWGLVLLGSNLTAGGACLFLVVCGKLWQPRMGIGDWLTLALVGVICSPIVVFGLMYLKRAYVGRK